MSSVPHEPPSVTVTPVWPQSYDHTNHDDCNTKEYRFFQVLNKELKTLAAVVANDQGNWKLRQDSMGLVADLIEEGSQQYGGPFHQLVARPLLELLPVFEYQLHDLRSEVVRQCTHLIITICEHLRLEACRFAHGLFPALLVTSVGSNRVIRTYCQAAAVAVVRCCESKSVLGTLCNEVTSNARSRTSKDVAIELLRIALAEWPIPDFERRYRTHLQQLEKAIVAGLRLATQSSRDRAAECYWLYRERVNPSAVQRLDSDLDARDRKIIQKIDVAQLLESVANAAAEGVVPEFSYEFEQSIPDTSESGSKDEFIGVPEIKSAMSKSLPSIADMGDAAEEGFGVRQPTDDELLLNPAESTPNDEPPKFVESLWMDPPSILPEEDIIHQPEQPAIPRTPSVSTTLKTPSQAQKTRNPTATPPSAAAVTTPRSALTRPMTATAAVTATAPTRHSFGSTTARSGVTRTQAAAIQSPHQRARSTSGTGLAPQLNGPPGLRNATPTGSAATSQRRLTASASASSLHSVVDNPVTPRGKVLTPARGTNASGGVAAAATRATTSALPQAGPLAPGVIPAKHCSFSSSARSTRSFAASPSAGGSSSTVIRSATQRTPQPTHPRRNSSSSLHIQNPALTSARTPSSAKAAPATTSPIAAAGGNGRRLSGVSLTGSLSGLGATAAASTSASAPVAASSTGGTRLSGEELASFAASVAAAEMDEAKKHSGRAAHESPHTHVGSSPCKHSPKQGTMPLSIPSDAIGEGTSSSAPESIGATLLTATPSRSSGSTRISVRIPTKGDRRQLLLEHEQFVHAFANALAKLHAEYEAELQSFRCSVDLPDSTKQSAIQPGESSRESAVGGAMPLSEEASADEVPSTNQDATEQGDVSQPTGEQQRPSDAQPIDEEKSEEVQAIESSEAVELDKSGSEQKLRDDMITPAQPEQAEAIDAATKADALQESTAADASELTTGKKATLNVSEPVEEDLDEPLSGEALKVHLRFVNESTQLLEGHLNATMEAIDRLRAYSARHAASVRDLSQY